MNIETYRYSLWKPGGLGLLAVVLLASWLTAQLILGVDSSKALFFITPVLFASLLFFTVKNWRIGLWVLLAWLLFEDMLRKFMGNNMAVYFGKDVIAGVIYLTFYAARRRSNLPKLRPAFWIPLVVFFWWTFLEMFNPNSPSVWYGALGMKLYFYYVPLFFVGYAVFRNEGDLRRFLQFNLIIAGIIAALGIVQAIVGPAFLNPANIQDDIRELSSLVRQDPITGSYFYRPSSVFVSDGRFTYYLLMTWLLAAGSATYWFIRHLPGKKLVFLVLGLVSLALVLSGGRAALLLSAGSIVPFVLALSWGLPGTKSLSRRAKWAFAATVIVSLLALIGFTQFYPEEISYRWGFYVSTLSPSSKNFQLEQRAFSGPIEELVKAYNYPNWFLGYGTGTCSLGVQYMTRILGVPRLIGVGVESGYGALILEVGVVGLLLWLVWTIAVILSAWGAIRNLKGSPLFPIAIAIGLFTFVVLFPLTAMSNSGYQNFVVNAYLWLLMGILFRLPTLELESDVPREIRSNRDATHYAV